MCIGNEYISMSFVFCHGARDLSICQCAHVLGAQFKQAKVFCPWLMGLRASRYLIECLIIETFFYHAVLFFAFTSIHLTQLTDKFYAILVLL